MGVDISDIVIADKVVMEDLKTRSIAIDGYNSLYQFLSIIRQPDGTPLKDRQGRVTSHLAGLLYRTANMVEAGIRPAYIFDGKPHKLKMDTIMERVRRKEEARVQWKEAVARGDMETARTKAQQTSKLTREMKEDAQHLLDLLGVPWLDAPSEGECQASYMASKGDTWAAASQDFDSILFGAPKLVRNLTTSGRRKLPRKQVYVDVMPEIIELDRTLNALEVTREQLVDIAILVGTDFNQGIKGIGPKTALKLVKKLGDLEAVLAERGEEVPEYQEIRRIFLEPAVTDDYELAWNKPDSAAVTDFLCNERDFSEGRVRRSLEKFEGAVEKRAQRSLDSFF